MTRWRACALACVVVLAGCASDAPDEIVTEGARYAETVELPPPDGVGRRPLEEVLASRRSTREYGGDPLPIEVVGQLLWSAQSGVTVTMNGGWPARFWIW